MRDKAGELKFGEVISWKPLWKEFLSLTSPHFLLICIYLGYDNILGIRKIVNKINNRKK